MLFCWKNVLLSWKKCAALWRALEACPALCLLRKERRRLLWSAVSDYLAQKGGLGSAAGGVCATIKCMWTPPPPGLLLLN